MAAIAPNHFDRGKLFYPLVMNYLLQVIGFKEVALRGVPGVELRAFLTDPGLASRPADDPDVQRVHAQIRKLAGPLDLRCESHPDRIKVDVNQVASEVVENHLYLIDFLMRAAGSLLVLAHEVAKKRGYRDDGPLWEFLRHCRNASAHGGRFQFVGSEPRRPAAWAGMEITTALTGVPLFKDASGVGFLSPGDPIRLLWDLEQAYPSMVA